MLVVAVKTNVRASPDFDLEYRNLKEEVRCANLVCRL